MSVIAALKCTSAAAILSASFGATLGSAMAQEPATAALIRARIQSMEQSLDAAGLSKSKTTRVIVKTQPKAEPLVMALSLKQGDGGLIAAFCHPDCKEVEVKLIDASGAVVEEDKDVQAVVPYTIEKDGDYKVTFVFPGCASAACDVGVVFRVRDK